MPYSFVQLYLFKCDVCVLKYIWINPNFFLIILYVFGSDFYHSLCSGLMPYFVFHCLNIFCVEKQVSEFFVTHSRLTRDSFCDSQVTQRKLQVHPKAFATHLVTHENFHDSLNRKTLKNSFLKGFSWETYFKPLLSSLKSLFQYFYI